MFKKKYIIIFIVIIILIDIGLIFVWYKNNKREEGVSLEQKRCLEEFENKSDQETINSFQEIKNNKRKETLFLNYYSCRLKNNNIEENHQSIISDINYLNLDKNTKDNILSKLSEIYKDKYNWEFYTSMENNCTLALAFAETSKYCPDKLSEICGLSRSEKTDNSLKIEYFKERASLTMCEKLERSMNDRDYLDNEILKIYSPETVVFKKTDNPNERSPIGGWRVGIAYRVAGRDYAYRLCDDMPSNRKEECDNFVKGHIDDIEKYVIAEERCDKYIKRMGEAVCQK